MKLLVGWEERRIKCVANGFGKAIAGKYLYKSFLFFAAAKTSE
jgi:hypothetical protein